MIYADFCNQTDKTTAQKTLIKIIDYITKRINFTEIRIHEQCNPYALNMLIKVWFMLDTNDKHFEKEYVFTDVALINMDKHYKDFLMCRRILLNELSKSVEEYKRYYGFTIL